MTISEMYQRTTKSIRQRDKWFWLWIGALVFSSPFWLTPSSFQGACEDSALIFLVAVWGGTLSMCYAFGYAFYMLLLPIAVAVYCLMMELGWFILGALSGFAVLGRQVYLFLRSGEWTSLSLFKAPISESGNWIGFVKIANWIGLNCPLSIVVGVFVAIFIRLMESDYYQMRRWQQIRKSGTPRETEFPDNA